MAQRDASVYERQISLERPFALQAMGCNVYVVLVGTGALGLVGTGTLDLPVTHWLADYSRRQRAL